MAAHTLKKKRLLFFAPLNEIQFLILPNSNHQHCNISPNQQIHYFWFLTENIISNDPILIKLFIKTLQGNLLRMVLEALSRHWVIQRLSSSLFLRGRYRNNDAYSHCYKAKARRVCKDFIERFCNVSLRCSYDM